uniref:Variant interspersed repeats 21 n=1 Tax=Plasmodium vivax TaxID=5855 RepID=A0A7M1I5C0_PLAVI|nr:variant interspersed repeats 21 [Plasmodium vivax]
MSEEVIEYKKLIDKDSTLGNNDLYNFYNKFNNSCENFNDEVFCNVDLYNGVKENVKDILRKLMRNVNKLSMNKGQDYNSIDKGNYNNKRCIYLKYWLYDIILANKFDESNISRLFHELSQNKGKVTSIDKKCVFYRLSLSEIKDIKKLYDYFVFFDGYNFVENIINEKIYNNRYLDYLKGAIDVYKKTEISCPKSENTKGYCNELNKYIKVYIDENVLYSLEKKILNEDIVTLIEKTLEPKSALLKPPVQGVLEERVSEKPNINKVKNKYFLKKIMKYNIYIFY